jgi:hypothetical protein
MSAGNMDMEKCAENIEKCNSSRLLLFLNIFHNAYVITSKFDYKIYFRRKMFHMSSM